MSFLRFMPLQKECEGTGVCGGGWLVGGGGAYYYYYSPPPPPPAAAAMSTTTTKFTTDHPTVTICLSLCLCLSFPASHLPSKFLNLSVNRPSNTPAEFLQLLFLVPGAVVSAHMLQVVQAIQQAPEGSS